MNNSRVLQKYVDESRVYRVDFTDKIEPNDTLDAILSCEGSDPALTVGAAQIDGNNVAFRLEDGVVGALYTVCSKVTTQGGDELVGVLAIEIIPDTQV